MLNDYFRHQADIINIESHFRCPDDCNAPGCWMEDVIVETTLFDLIRLSRSLNISVSRLFSQCCRIGLVTCQENIRYKRLLVKMKKPCPFLCGNRCLVHDAKPLNCILFPEYYEIKGLLPELTKKPIFHSFPCLKKPVAVSGKRYTALIKLQKMSSLDQVLTHDYLFNIPRFIIDAAPLRKNLRRNNPKTSKFSLRDYDNVLDDILNSLNFSEYIMKKITELDTIAGVRNLSEQRFDHVRMEGLMRKATQLNVVYKIKRHHMKSYKRNLHSPEVPFI
jgi:Fe-S-cluster containining protein